MAREGQQHTWMTRIYWTLTVMSTLGFGDITFHTDAGRLFSLLALITGVLFLLVLRPFTFIEFSYAPWMKAQAQAPRELPSDTLTGRNIEWKMIEKLSEWIRHSGKAIQGDAAEFDIIVESGLRESSSVIIATHDDDDQNIFLTIVYRRLRPNIQIIRRLHQRA